MMRPLGLPLLAAFFLVLLRPLPSWAMEESSLFLPAPQNLTIQSYHFENVLKWSPVKGINRTVSYRVEYRLQSDERWEEVKCTDITKPECDFDHGKDFYRIILRVRAEQGGLKSSWSQADPFQAKRDTMLGPPRAINVTTEANSLILRFLPPFAYRGNSFVFYYRIYSWEESVGRKDSITTKNTEKKFKDLKERTVYCFQVQAIYKGNEGQKSDTYCKKTTTTEASLLFWILGFGIAVFAIFAVFMCLWLIRKFKSAIKSFWEPPLRIPSHYEEDLQNAHVVTFQNCAEEYCETVSVISCMDESQILRDSSVNGNQVDISEWKEHR
ncbi:interferon gamma receptor 2 [Sceloporus undulatus]|uniref:interferon gamma receptor 2 n=1 Tax=Sceloporus undulatus TaxID=8520 RepID=UPI001C4B9471|nr:interferon gamma receptor 2 [Sceloporus undulatus]